MTSTIAAPASHRDLDAADPTKSRAGRIKRLWRGRAGDPAWVRPAVLALLGGTALLYLWGLDASGWANSFYAAAVQASTKSWKAFFYGSFDSANFITVDKSPGSLWVMDLSARIFGLNSWSMLVPQALEGVATVGVVYLTVRRWFPPAAGIAAGVITAVTPVGALMFRYNNPDAFMVLLITLSAYATVRAVEDGRTRWIVLAGSLIGFGFLAKMLQAMLVVPAVGLVYVVAAPGPLRRRILQLFYGLLALLVSAGWWVAAVQLTPAADRPYIGGSQNNSLWNLIFGYNGFGRLTGNETGSVGGGGGSAGNWGPTGLTRLFGAEMGTQISWVLPAALILMVAGLYVTRRTPRNNQVRASLLLWGGWLIVTGLAFSLGKGIIHPYYTVALAPAIGALVGSAGYLMWAHRDLKLARSVLAAVTATTAVWAFVLLDRTPHWLPWLRVTVLLSGGFATVGLLAWPWIGRSVRATVATGAVLAALAAPLAYTLDTVNTAHSGAIPTAGPAGGSVGSAGGGPARGATRAGLGFPGAGSTAPGGLGGAGGFPGGGAQGKLGGGSIGNANGVGVPSAGFPTGTSRAGRASGGGAGGLLDASRPSAALTRLLSDGASKYTWIAATVGANEAAGYQLATGDPVMAIGGFNGTDPYPTLAEFEKLVHEGTVHYFIAAGTGASAGGPGLGGGGAGNAGAGGSSISSAIETWVTSHYTSTSIDGIAIYDLSAAASS
jgi:4-amino-4-deoxy-L-arabinose transferase-like glycosyltransferase